MKVVAYDPFLTPERAVELGVEKVELDELLARADFITLHTPLTDQTRNILSARESRQDQEGRAHHQLRARRPDRRGGAEGRARFSGHVAGAALDVFVEEPAKDIAAVRHARTSSPRRISAPRPPRRRSTSRSRSPSRWPIILVRGGVTNALNMPSLSAEEAPQAASPTWRWPRSSAALVGQLDGRRDQRRLDRGRGRRRRAQPEADHRRGARRA